MKWITREHVKVDRVACPWLIRKFVDSEAEFYFVPSHQVMSEAEKLGAVPFDVPAVELGHHGKECSFEAIVRKYSLAEDPALALLAKIVNGADTDNTLWQRPEAAGLRAVAEGFRHLGFKDDYAINSAEWVIYDALYALLHRDGEAWETEMGSGAKPSKTHPEVMDIEKTLVLISRVQLAEGIRHSTDPA